MNLNVNQTHCPQPVNVIPIKENFITALKKKRLAL